MLPTPAVKAIHQALQTIYSDSIVLLGGSYWTGEAGKNSDLDFYILRGWRHFFVYKKYFPAVKQLKQQYRGTAINCLVMPRFFYERGWYFTAGETVGGAVWQSPLNTKIVFRSAVKLAYWNYVLYLTAKRPAEKQFTLAKMAQHLAVAKALLVEALPCRKGFAASFLLEQLSLAGISWNPVKAMLTAKKNGAVLSFLELDQMSRQLLALAEGIFLSGRRHWRFSLANYLIYNGKFLCHKNPLFLFKNPDKMIVDRLRGELENKMDLIKLRAELGTVVFPVIMV